MAYYWAPPLLSDNVPITIPDRFINDLLFEMCMDMIEGDEYGNATARTQKIQLLMKDFNTAYSARPNYRRPRISPTLNA
jgi:hypothetical protein